MRDRSRLMKLKPHRERGEVMTDAAVQAKELELAGAIMRTVLAIYPGYVWGVLVDFKGGIATLKLPYLMRASHCYCVHLDKISTWPEMQKVMRKAGGELLERFRLDRAGFNVTDFQEARKLAVTSHGQKMPE